MPTAANAISPVFRWALGLLVTSVAVRAGIWYQYEFITVDDSSTYVAAAQGILLTNPPWDDGGRTPGYPAFLALGRLETGTIWMMQMSLGAVTSMLLFATTFHLTQSAALSFAVGLGHSLNLAQLFFEAVLASETLATVLVIATSTCLVLAVAPAGSHGRFWSLASGFAAAAAALTRPQYVFLPAVVAFFVGLAARRSESLSLRASCRRAALALLPGAVAVLGWCAVNYARHDYFALSTYMGINLTNHSIVLVDAATTGHEDVVEVLIRHRNEKIRRTGRHTMAVWEALPELREKTGLQNPALSRVLAGMSLDLFLRHPVRYAWGVLHAWKDFWMVPNYWQPERLRAPGVKQGLEVLWGVQRWVLRFANGLFLLVLLMTLAGWPPVLRLRWDPGLGVIASTVFGSSAIQAFVEYGENPRYAVPVQPLVVLTVSVLSLRLTSNLRSAPEIHDLRARASSTLQREAQ